MWIIELGGGPTRLVGPFDTEAAAHEYGEAEFATEQWVVARLEAPVDLVTREANRLRAESMDW